MALAVVPVAVTAENSDAGAVSSSEPSAAVAAAVAPPVRST